MAFARGWDREKRTVGTWEIFRTVKPLCMTLSWWVHHGGDNTKSGPQCERQTLVKYRINTSLSFITNIICCGKYVTPQTPWRGTMSVVGGAECMWGRVRG